MTRRATMYTALAFGLIFLDARLAWAGMPGDVDGNCRVDVADVVLYERWLQGLASIDPELLANADVAPFGSNPGDGVTDAADLVVLERAVAGDVTLPLPPAAPVLYDVTMPTPNPNPITVSFDLALAPGQQATVEFKVNGHVQPDTVTVPDGSGEQPHHPLIVLFDGTNTITATATIGGKTSCVSAPIQVDYHNTLSRTNPIGTSIEADTALTPGDQSPYTGAYVITGTHTIAQGKHLILQPGVILKFGSGAKLVVAPGASLRVQGDSLSRIVFTTSQASGSETVGNWAGIEIRLSHTQVTQVSIDQASIFYASTGVKVIGPASACATGTSVEIRNSQIQWFSIAIALAENPTVTIDNIVIRNDPLSPLSSGNLSTVSGSRGIDLANTNNVDPLNSLNPITIRNSLIRTVLTGIWIENASPSIQANVFQHYFGSGTAVGVFDDSNPTIQGNTLNTPGDGDICTRLRVERSPSYSGTPPQPRIEFNRINQSNQQNCFSMTLDRMTSADPAIDARNNYWGVATPQQVLPLIFKAAFTTVVVRTLPILDVNLNPIGTDTILHDSLSGTLDPTKTYMVDGPAFVASGQTLTVPAGTTVKFNTGSGAALSVDGRLEVTGAPANLVKFTTSATPQQSTTNDWGGISVDSDGAELDIAYAEISYAPTGVSVSNISDTSEQDIRITNSLIHDTTYAISMTNVASALIDGNQIGPLAGRTAITVVNSSPRLTNNTISTTATAIDVSGPLSLPVIGGPNAGNSIETFTLTGISMTGTGGGVIDGNMITNTYSNQTGQGIALTNSSPTITGNAISGTYFGIQVYSNSNPIINGGNVLTGNVWGILLRGDRPATPNQSYVPHNPAPVIEQNELSNHCGAGPNGCATYSPVVGDLCPSDGGNICLYQYAYDVDQVIDARENYWGGTNFDSIQPTIIAEASNPVPIDFSSLLNALGGTPVGGPAFTSLFTDVSRVPEIIRPTLVSGDHVTIAFGLLANADNVTLRILEEKQGTELVAHSFTGTLTAPGPYSFDWDGKTNGEFVQDGAYSFKITAVGPGGHTYTYQLARDGPTFAGSTEHTTNTWNAHRNQYLKALIYNSNAPTPMRVKMILELPTGYGTNTLVERALATNQQRLFVFDGWNPFPVPPVLLTNTDVTIGLHADVQIDPSAQITRNAIFVQDTAPSVFGESYSWTPSISNVEVLADPYLTDPTYDQVSEIRYQLDQDADVSMTILKPGAFDASDPANVVARLIPGEWEFQQAKDAGNHAIVHSVDWLGYDTADPSATEVLQAAQSGSYTFLIEAQNHTQPNLKSSYRGTIQVRLAPGM